MMLRPMTLATSLAAIPRGQHLGNDGRIPGRVLKLHDGLGRAILFRAEAEVVEIDPLHHVHDVVNDMVNVGPVGIHVRKPPEGMKLIMMTPPSSLSLSSASGTFRGWGARPYLPIACIQLVESHQGLQRRCDVSKLTRRSGRI